MNKNNIFRFFAAVLCSLILLGACPAASFAAAENSFPIIRSAEVSGDNSLRVICSDVPYLPEEISKDGDYSVLIEGTEIEANSSLFGDNEIPVTVVCLFDISNSNNSALLRLAQETVSGLAKSLRKGDNLVIATVSDKLTIGEPMTDTEEISKAIDAVALSQENSNLFNGISECVQLMTSSNIYNENKALVVLSTARDYNSNGKSTQEISDEIRNARFPVYTVALLKSADYIEKGKTLGSFARSSCGGLALSNVDKDHVNRIRNDVPAAEFYEAIWQSINSAVILDAAVPVKFQNEKKVELTVKFGTEENGISDSVALTVFGVPGAIPPPDPSGKIEQPVEPVSSPEPNTDVGFNSKDLIMYCVIGAAVIVIIVLIIVLAAKKKKRAPAAPAQKPAGGSETSYQGAYSGGETESIPDNIEPTSVARSRFKVIFTDIPYGRSNKKFDLSEGTIKSFGRSKQKADYELNSEDSELSGKHFSIVISSSGICLRDDKSTNGTLVNGIRVNPNVWVKLSSGDKIKAGSCEYRFTVTQN